MRKLIQIVFMMLLFSELSAQNLDSLLNNKRVYRAVNIGSVANPRIDGNLDDAIWLLGEWQSDFTQQQPYGNTSGTEETFVKVLYDKSCLYVAIVCKDEEPEKIRDLFDRRDALSGDMTGIAFDSYYDKRTAFEFDMSAGGQKIDIKHKGDYLWDLNWNAVWDGASAVHDSGWTAEMKIPFSQLRYANKKEHVWGMHVWRWIDRRKEEDQWQYIPLEAPAMVYLFGQIEGIEDIRESRQVEFLPYLLGSYNDRFGYNGGLNAKVGISSDYTLDLVVNPDFGQVEADPSVLNLSSYETFYDEKRPFFLEGNDVFDFSMGTDIPYYSRRLGSVPSFPLRIDGAEMRDLPDRTAILSAAKFTGKNKKGLAFGIVNGLTARQHSIGTDINGREDVFEVAPLTNYLAGRAKKEFREGDLIIGSFFSMVDRISDEESMLDLLPSEAYSGGFDALHQWKNRNYFIEGKLIMSELKGSTEALLLKQQSHNHRFQRPGAEHLQVDSLAERLGGHGGLLKFGKKGGSWRFSGEAQYRSPGLDLNDMGYIRQSDYIAERLDFSYAMNEPTEKVRNYAISLYHDMKWSFGGEKIWNELGGTYSINSIKNMSLHVLTCFDFPHLDPLELRGGPALWTDASYVLGATFGSNSSKDLYASVGYYYMGAFVENFVSKTFEGSLTWVPFRKLRLSTQFNFSHIDYPQYYVSKLDIGGEEKYLVGHQNRDTKYFTFRGEWFLSPEMSVQYYGNPYFSDGRYGDFRIIGEAGSMDHDLRYRDIPIEEPSEEGTYTSQLGGDEFKFENPNFNFVQFRSNVVFRWEYKLGSTLYFVWSHNRDDWQPGVIDAGANAQSLLGLKSKNVFMLKLNYWFSL